MHLSKFVSLAGLALITQLGGQANEASAPVSATADSLLAGMADLSPEAIAKEADRLKAQMDRQKTETKTPNSAEAARASLKVKFQKEYAAAEDDLTRENLAVEYHAIQKALAAQAELIRRGHQTAVKGR